MRILYIHQYFCTRQGRSGTRSYEFARYLVGRGHRVTMLTTSPEVSDVQLPARKRIHRYQVDGIDVVAVRVAYAQRMGPLRRIGAFLHFMALSSWIACRSRRHDVVLATSTPLTVGVPGLLASWRWRVPFVFEVRDLWPEAPIQMGVIRNRGLIALLRWFERFLYRRSAHVVALSPGMRDGVVAAGTPAEKITVIPNGADIDLFSPGDADPELLVRLGLEGCFVALHAGSMGVANGLDVLVGAAARLQFEVEEAVRFLLVGEGSEVEALRVQVRSLGLRNVVIAGSVPRAEVAALVRASDVCLVLFRDLPVLGTNSPNKLFDALAAGRPVIINSGGWTRQLVEEHWVGLAAEPGSAESLAAQILWLHCRPEARREMGRRARRLAETHFERTALAAELEAVLARAVASRRAAIGQPEAGEDGVSLPMGMATRDRDALPMHEAHMQEALDKLDPRPEPAGRRR